MFSGVYGPNDLAIWRNRWSDLGATRSLWQPLVNWGNFHVVKFPNECNRAR